MINKTPEEEEKIKKMREEMQKYLEENKKKKAYGLYLTEEDVEIVKKHIKVPLSKVVDDFIKMMSNNIKRLEKLKLKEVSNKNGK